VLLLEIGAFIVRLPGIVRRANVGVLLGTFEKAPRPKAPTIEIAHARIARFRDAWLALPGLRRRNTCYIRALTLYRFLDPGEHRVRVHLGIEEPSSPDQRLHGHAWISIDGRPFEAPEAVLERRIREVPLPLAI
jgi:hypothetical protein